MNTKTNMIGYVAAMGSDNSEVTGGIDAFALGIYSVNPDAKVYVKVTNSWYDPEAEKQAAILKAEAQKEATIREAEGKAEAIMKVQQANADGIRFLKEAGADEAVLTMKSLEAFAKAADGKATKIIIPSEIQSIAGLVKSVTEIGADDKKEEK